MKKYIYIITLLLIIIISSCVQNEDDLSLFSDVMYATSSGNTNSALHGTIMVKKDGYMTFMDLSQGCVSHQWSITNQDGLTFLSSGFSPTPGDSLDRKQHIMSDTTSFEKTVNLFFLREGLYTLKLKNTFNDSVAYLNNSAILNPNTDLWEFTETFTIKVHGPLIPVVTLTKNNTEVFSASVDTIFLAAGDSITFNETSSGFPTYRTWTIPGGTPNTSSASHITSKFNTVGTYTPRLLIGRTSSSWPTIDGSASIKLPLIKVL